MTDLSPLTALGTPNACKETIGAYSILENTGLSLASIATPTKAKWPAPFKLVLPKPGCLSPEIDGKFAIWTAPNQWLLAAQDHDTQDFATQVSQELAAAYVTEQTDAWVSFDITSQKTAQLNTLLERLVNLPKSATHTGKATRTNIHHMNVFVLRPTTTNLTLLGSRSQAGSLWHTLKTTLQQRENADMLD